MDQNVYTCVAAVAVQLISVPGGSKIYRWTIIASQLQVDQARVFAAYVFYHIFTRTALTV